MVLHIYVSFDIGNQPKTERERDPPGSARLQFEMVSFSAVLFIFFVCHTHPPLITP